MPALPPTSATAAPTWASWPARWTRTGLRVLHYQHRPAGAGDPDTARWADMSSVAFAGCAARALCGHAPWQHAADLSGA